MGNLPTDSKTGRAMTRGGGLIFADMDAKLNKLTVVHPDQIRNPLPRAELLVSKSFKTHLGILTMQAALPYHPNNN